MSPELLAIDWSNEDAFPIYDWRFYDLQQPDFEGATEVYGVLHPDSLLSERLRVVIEFCVIDDHPILEFTWLNMVMFAVEHSKPVPGEPEWRRMIVSAPRVDGQPFGPGADMFMYRNRGIEVRKFTVEDYGFIGDANLDGLVNMNDLGVVIDHIGVDQYPDATDGDLNADGFVDIFDVFPVIEQMSNQSE